MAEAASSAAATAVAYAVPTALGIIVILAAVLVLMYAVYKGANSILACTLASMVICIGTGLPIVDTMETIVPNAYATQIQMMFMKFLCCIILGQLYQASGAALSVAHLVEKVVVGKSTGTARKTRYVLCMLGIGLVFGIGGFDTFLAVFTLIPVGLNMWRDGDLPRALLPGTLMGGLSAAACLPGTPLFANMMGQMFFGTNTTAARIPGYVGVAIMLAIDVVYILHIVKKYDKKGLHWDGDEAGVEMPPPGEKDRVNPILAIIPLAWIFVTVTVLGKDMVVCLFVAIILACVLFCNGIKAETPRLTGSKYGQVIGAGCTQTAVMMGFMGAQFALAQVVINTPQFDTLTGWFTKIPGNPYIGYSVAASLGGFFAGSSVAGMQMASAIYGPIADSLGITAPAMHRIAAFAVSILDTIPINGAVIATTTSCKLKMKQSYPAIAMTTVINVTVAMIVVAFMCAAFPGLCQS